MKKLTVIVPVYNVSQYLEECLESISRQDYPNMEVILVDDGSPDGSAGICDRKAVRDSRFIVVHKRNGGLSSARNTAIGLMDADYVTFVDSDDFLIGQPYTLLMETAARTGADMVAMDYHADRNAPGELVQPEYEQTEHNAEELFRHLLIQDVSESVWNKIYKRELFDAILFAEDVLNEDFLYFVKLLTSRDVKYIGVNYIVYYYRLRKGSTTSTFGHNMIDAVRNAVCAREQNPFASCERDADRYLLRKIFMYLVNMPCEHIGNGDPDYRYTIARLRELKNTMDEAGLSGREKFVLKGFLRKPGMTKRITDAYLSRKRT